MAIPRTINILLFILAVCLAVGAVWWLRNGDSPRDSGPIPNRFAEDLPDACRQVILVMAANETDHVAKLHLLEKESSEETWSVVSEPIPVTIGRNGLAWGTGEHRSKAPSSFRVKHEGDGCSPAGIFRLPFAFGYAESAPTLKLNYRHVTETLMGIEDIHSAYYNQVVDTTEVKPDWTSRETMRREDGLYEWGAFIANNPQNIPGEGSCIFMHLWIGPDVGTAGCTAMAAEPLQRVLRWLDPQKEPRLVQGLESW